MVLRLLRGSPANSPSVAARLIAALGGALTVAALDGMLAVVVWIVVVIAAALVGGRRARVVIGLVAVAGLVMAGAGSWALYRAADTLDDARDGTRRLERELLADPDEAAVLLGEVEADLRSARDSVSVWWARPAHYLPVMAHHFDLADRVIDASRAVVDASAPLVATTSSELVGDGKVNLSRLDELSGEVAVVAELAAAGERDLRGVDRRWLVGPAEDELDDALEDFEDQAERLDRLSRFSAETLQYLGAEGPARWFVLVCTPSEARASCGFPGNWVEFVIDDGRAELVDSGRIAALEDEAEAAGLTLRGPADFVTHYGRFTPVPTLRNITITPDFPSTAEALSTVLAELGRPQPDVIAAVNTEGLQGILRVTGPVDTEMGQLNVQSVRPRLEIEQYTRFETQRERREALDSSIRAVVDAVTALEDVEISKVRKLSEAIDAGGLLAYVPGDPGNVFVEMGVAGELPPGPLAGVTVQNAGANKLDAFRSVEMTLTPSTHDVAGCATVMISLGQAPAGSPDYVVGNEVGLEPGWIRSWVSIYTPTPVTLALLDGEPIAVQPRIEAGHPAVSLFLDTAPGATNTIELELDPGVNGEIATLVQPSTEPYTVELTETC